MKEDFENSNGNEQARTIGNIVGKIALAVIGTKGLDKGLDLIKVSAKTRKLASLAKRISKGQKLEAVDEMLTELGESKSQTRWDMSVGGGIINGRRYSQHAMERMAPNTPKVRAELYQRAIKIAKEKGLVPQTKEYSTFIEKYVDPRNILPSMIEDAIKNTKSIPGNRPDTFIHTTDSVKVITNGNGDVITVIPK